MRRLPQLGVIAALAIVATLGFHGSLDGWGFIASSLLGVGIGLIALLLAKHYRLYVGESVALSTVLFALGGGLATLGSYRSFSTGLISGWAHLLSSTPPATLTPELRALPYVVGWGAMLIGGELSRRAAQPALPIIGPVTAMAITALVSVEAPRIVAFQGVAMAIGALSLGLLHQWFVIDPLQGEDSPGTRSRRALAVALTALIAVIAPLAGPALPFAGANERFDLREHQARPWDPLAEPSPLVTLKASLKEGRSQDPVFTVTSGVPLTRWTSAVLASYNGTVWAVADEGPGAPAEFEPVDRQLPPSADTENQESGDNPSVGYRIELAEPTLWVPVAGRAIEVDGAMDLRFNPATGTIAAPQRLGTGQTLEIISIPRPEPALVDLLPAEVPIDDGADLELVPPQMRNLAGDLFEGVDPGPARVLVLADRFTHQGFYDHSEATRPGHNLARLDEFLADPDRVVGYAEQYAASAGVLSQLGGLPTRVVVGYKIPAERYVDDRAVVMADDIAAWVEIRTIAFGWVPVDVTPDRAREPQEESLGVTITDVAIPNPPPPPPPPPDDQVAARPEIEDDELDEAADDDESDRSFGSSIPTVAIVGTTAIGLPLTLLATMGGMVVLAKRRRRKRRRMADPPDKITGAWREVIDGYAEAGLVVSAATTPDEAIAALVRSDPSAANVECELRRLAAHVDRAAFHPKAPEASAAADAWERSENAMTALRASRTRWQRLAMSTDPRSLLRRHPDPGSPASSRPTPFSPASARPTPANRN